MTMQDGKRQIFHPVILSGGSGMRLWPLSRHLYPKQFLSLHSGGTLFQETVTRVHGDGFAGAIVVCNHEHRFLVAEQGREIGIPPRAIILEPSGRNTGPAVAVAALWLAERSEEGLMLVLPSDHIVDRPANFRRAVASGAAAAERGALVTFGITPTGPETGYGYIERGARYDGAEGCFTVGAFKEKPNRATAEDYVRSGSYAWNSGIFLFRPQRYIEELERLRPKMLAACRRAVDAAVEDLDFLRLDAAAYADCESDSIDYAVMEHTADAAMVPVDMGWNDVGSWSALWENGARDEAGNLFTGDVVAVDVEDTFVRTEKPLIAAIGVKDLVVVATDDAVLVASRDRAQDVKTIVQRLEKEGRPEHHAHSTIHRPWGSFQSVQVGERFQVKQIMVKPGAKLSLQMHHHRAEHWVVVAGTACVTRDNETFLLSENQSTYIPLGVRHSLENPGKVPLRLIEVQSGPYLGEDDIVRLEDVYGRL